MGKEVVGAAINGLRRYNMVACVRNILYRIGDCRRAGCSGQRRNASFQRRHAPLKDIKRRIGQPAVDIAGLRQRKPCLCLCGVFKYIGCRLIDWHAARAGSGVGRLLTCVELQGFKAIIFLFRHSIHSLPSLFQDVWLCFVQRRHIRSRKTKRHV